MLLNRREKIILVLIILSAATGAIINIFTLPAPKAIENPVFSAKNPFPININTANEQELLRLPGIGPEYARRIAEYREKNGYFKKKEELLRVKGIGPKKYEKIHGLITTDE